MHAELTFLAERSEPPAFTASAGGAEAHSELIGSYEARDVELQDGRALGPTDLDREGFRLLRHASAVRDVYDELKRTGPYEAECRELVARATGAAHTYVFDHTLRSTDPDRREQTKSREPSAFVHCDYTVRSGPQRVRDVLGQDAEAWLRRPFAIVNVWRPLRTVESSPLAVCDARTIKPDNLVPAERRAANRVGEIYMVRYDRDQKWLWFPRMTPDEVLLIKTYDSRTDGRARWCIHTSLEPGGVGATVAPRESIESRVFAFFGTEESWITR